MMKVVIIRGLPGSFKSTLGRKLSAKSGTVLLEKDQFRIRDGRYVFNEHDYVPQAFLNVIQEYAKFGADIIVTGVFATEESIDRVLSHIYKAKPLGCALCVGVVHCRGQFGNIHNVPETIIASMRESWEPFAFEINAPTTAEEK